jgi:hypothetical protein
MTYRTTARQRSINTFQQREILNKRPVAGQCLQKYATIKSPIDEYRTNTHADIKIRNKNKGVFYVSARVCFVGNCVITRLYNYRGAVFSVLRDPCRDFIRETV